MRWAVWIFLSLRQQWVQLKTDHAMKLIIKWNWHSYWNSMHLWISHANERHCRNTVTRNCQWNDSIVLRFKMYEIFYFSLCKFVANIVLQFVEISWKNLKSSGFTRGKEVKITKGYKSPLSVNSFEKMKWIFIRMIDLLARTVVIWTWKKILKRLITI